ncbi:MAG: hypothetical protein WC705_02630 [Candidatus Paceibacterota bacterium]|jgi:hypothetical protein
MAENENKKEENPGPKVESLDKQEGEIEEREEGQGESEEDGEEEDEDGEESEDEEGGNLKQKSGPHFDFVESFFYISMAILSDIFDGLWISRFFFAPATLLWLYMKGLNNVISKNAIAQGVELIPVVGFLPLSTIAAVLTIWITNNPESFNKVFGVAGKIFQKVAKRGKK